MSEVLDELKKELEEEKKRMKEERDILKLKKEIQELKEFNKPPRKKGWTDKMANIGDNIRRNWS